MKRLLKGLLILVFGVMSWIPSVPPSGRRPSSAMKAVLNNLFSFREAVHQRLICF